MSHTILLIQPYGKPDSRTYSDYETVDECMEGVCKIFEEHLKRANPSTPSITYDISQLFDYIDKLTDLSCLTYHSTNPTNYHIRELKHRHFLFMDINWNLRPKDNSYAPHNKEWIKEQIYIMLRKQAGK